MADKPKKLSNPVNLTPDNALDYIGALDRDVANIVEYLDTFPRGITQATEPSIQRNIHAFWNDTANSKFYLMKDFSGTTKKIDFDAAGMTYPGAGIALSTGAAWDTSITDNSTNWDAAFSHVSATGASHSYINQNVTTTGTPTFGVTTLGDGSLLASSAAPTTDAMIANKKYVDDNAGGGGDLKADGSVPLTANWDVGAFTITGTQFISDIAIGTAPLVVTSTTVVPNLNVDQVDGYDLDQDVSSGSGPAFTNATLTTPALGTPSAGVLTNCTGLPAASVLAGTLGTGAYVFDSTVSGVTGLVLSDGGTIGSASDTDVMTIDASGNTTFSVFPITPSAAPDADYEVANKKYVDDNAGGAPEGTAVLSTGEGGGTKFLREDGDGTCSWQAAGGGGDVSKVGTPVDNQIGVWTGDGTIEGTSAFTFDGTTVVIPGQIQFPASQSASANANTLDDYEEGEYTATLTCGTSGTITINSAQDQLFYTKIGKRVNIQGQIQVSSVSSPLGILRLNLPFAVSSATENAARTTGSIFYTGINAIGSGNALCFFLQGGSSVDIVELTTTSYNNDVSNHVAASSYWAFSLSYITT